MPCSPELAQFIKTHFPSVWALELLVFLKQNSSRRWRKEQLVKEMRASDSIISSGLRWLHAGGLVEVAEDGAVQYSTATADLEEMVVETEALYALKAGAVRNLIINASAPALSAFSESFKFRRDP